LELKLNAFPYRVVPTAGAWLPDVPYVVSSAKTIFDAKAIYIVMSGLNRQENLCFGFLFWSTLTFHKQLRRIYLVPSALIALKQYGYLYIQ
jgi:hypothetical protein